MNTQGMVPVLVPPQFARFMAEFFGDKRGVLWPVANILQQKFALDIAQPEKEYELEGDFIYADSDSTGIMYIKFNNAAMPWIPVKTNLGISGFPIRRVFVKWEAQAGKQINLLYGYGAQVIPPNQEIASITSGIDGILGDKLTTDGEAFIIGGNMGAVAGQYPELQLWNPPGSGIVVYVDTASWSTGVESRMDAYLFNAALAFAMFPANGFSKDRGSASVSKAEFRTENNALLPSSAVQAYAIGSGTAREGVKLEIKPALRLPEGTGLLLSGGLASYLNGNFQWREKAV